MTILKRLNCRSVVLFLLVLCAGCKKGDDTSEGQGDYYIRFKVNGVQKEYSADIPNNAITYFYLNDVATYNASLTALNRLEDAQSLPVKNLINIVVRSKEEINGGVPYYMQTPVSIGSVNLSSIEITYADESGATFNAVLLQENYPALDIRDDATVEFDEINASTTRGTFNARLSSTVNSEEVLLTDGEFYLPSRSS